MKRLLIPFFLLLILVLPVSASNEGLTEVSEFTDKVYSTTGTYINVTIPGADINYHPITLVDILFTSNAPVTSIEQTNDDNLAITVESLGDGYYRAYGSTDAVLQSNNIFLGHTFKFSLGSPGTGRTRTINIISFKVAFGVDPYKQFEVDTTFNLALPWDQNFDYGTYDESYEILMEPLDSDTPIAYTLMLWPENANAYDYIDFKFYHYGYSLETITATYSGKVLDYDLSLNNPDTSTWSERHYTLRVYLDGISRVDGIDPLIHIVGSFNSNIEDSMLILEQTYGYLKAPEENVNDSLLRKILNALTGNEESDYASDDYAEKVEEQDELLGGLTSDLNAVDRPDIGNIQLSPVGMVDTSVVTLTTTGISTALGNEILIRVLLIALTFALAGFILYGKK